VGRSAARNCGPMDKNRIENGALQGERASYREALVTTFHLLPTPHLKCCTIGAKCTAVETENRPRSKEAMRSNVVESQWLTLQIVV
jgi:hypothetical protein